MHLKVNHHEVHECTLPIRQIFESFLHSKKREKKIRKIFEILQLNWGFFFKFGPGESNLGFGEYEKAEYLGRGSERLLEILSVKSNKVHSNRFWEELSTDNRKF